ncbi:sigma intracellular receptor 2-like [Crassostrea angulata]|uniref:sigma intracellular receptor 2-like n=1 Tax=Magallana angulata TaxID=2784310 RepID=UPI0022B10600|nr:sigma intracellular receptor 2-like [Crassostrea angulata]
MFRIADFVFLFYFVSHIPITILFDSQVIFPSWIYPKMLVDVKNNYCESFKDVLMADPPPWFKSFCLCEILVQFPFFFVATYALWKGVQNCQWIRVPFIVYSTHVATTTIAICFHILMESFNHPKYPGPDTLKERLSLLAVYAPYLIVPFLMLLDSLFSGVYTKKVKRS